MIALVVWGCAAGRGRPGAWLAVEPQFAGWRAARGTRPWRGMAAWAVTRAVPERVTALARRFWALAAAHGAGVTSILAGMSTAGNSQIAKSVRIVTEEGKHCPFS